MRNLKLSGFYRPIYPINPNARSILGYRSYPNLEAVKSSLDLAVVALPAEKVEQSIRDCVASQVRGVIIITSGFSEIGKSDLEQKLLDIASPAGMRIVGPNTFGIFSAKCKMNCTFGPNYVLSGKTAFITQSGALGLALMAWTTEENYGVSAMVSIGNKSDVDDADLVRHFSEDESTKSILIYMEGLKNGKRFYEAAKETAPKKPIIVIKAGRTMSGAGAASSHTGSIAGADIVYSAAFKQAGVLRADTMTQAFDWLQAINENPVPKGENIVVVTNGGGIGVLAADECDELGLHLMNVPKIFRDELTNIMPSFGSMRNPIDLTANANEEIYHHVLDMLMEREDVHGIIALFCQTASIDPALVADAMVSTEGVRIKKKPMTAAFIGGHLAEVAYKRMLEKKFAAYPTAERAVDAMYALTLRRREVQQ